MRNVLHIGRKELTALFSSPAAFIFIAVFLAVSLFIFFWVERFFARNIADVRPLFEWMPVLLVFLVSALTMRSWSEERRSGTLELVLSSPVSPIAFIIGKFLACWALVAISLVLTLGVAFTVAALGPIDWGPVVGAYVATLILAAAYIAIGLFVSARTDNQIVSLIVSSVVCGAFYMIGAGTFTSLFGQSAAEVLQLLGSGSRFESITRGVLDVRDLYYYVSIVGVFLALNWYSLERLRWSASSSKTHRRWLAGTGLVVVNLLAANVWLQQIPWARADLTQGNAFSISAATRGYLAQLNQPLLIRGYFSAETHPLLAPLVPQVRDLIKEYEIAGDGRVRVEFVDPIENPALEEEANRRFGIEPVAFQTTSKYKSAVTNAYFDVVVQYGDQFESLSYQDLIDVKAGAGNDLDVALRNPEYDITRAIKKVLYGYRAAGDLWRNIASPVTLKAYVSPTQALPEEIRPLRTALDEVIADLEAESGGKFNAEIYDPDAGDGAMAETLEREYGFRPMALSLLDQQGFWFYLTLESEGRIVQGALPENMTAEGLKASIEAGLQQFSTGLLNTVALYEPPMQPGRPQYGIPSSGHSFRLLRDTLGENAIVKRTDLSKGRVPGDTDLLMVMAPQNLDDKQLFAIDQFLMKGGTVVMATSPHDISFQGSLSAPKADSGVGDWLAHNGLTIGDSLVMDRQSGVFPVPVDRKVGEITIRDMRMMDYPYFVDVRDDGLNPDVAMTAGLGQLTLSWPSPITVDDDKTAGRTVTRLIESSPQSWTAPGPDIQPDFAQYGEYGFAEGTDKQKHLLAVAVEGQFESFFKGKPNPLLQADAETDAAANGGQGAGNDEETPTVSGFIEKSPESGRIVLIASNVFASDNVLQLAASVNRSQYLAPVQLLENAVDWSLEDRGLLSIRSRGHFARTLVPMTADSQAVWEYANYGVAVLGVVTVFVLFRLSRKQATSRYARILSQGSV